MMLIKMVSFVLVSAMLCSCAASAVKPEAPAEAESVRGANAFNPFMNKTLPNMREMNSESSDILTSLGARRQSIEGEAAHRQNWREELYPVVFGEKTAPQEIIVLLDFANPESEKVWRDVVEASKSLKPAQCKIAVFGRSEENYGTDLMGLAIWIAHSRPGQAMPFLTYALEKWNQVKAAQQKAGTLKKFTNEYDATASAQDYPIHYAYLSRLNPPVPASQELEVARYCYNAGNVNMYQATQVAKYYGVRVFPAVVVNGKTVSPVTAQSILNALK